MSSPASEWGWRPVDVVSALAEAPGAIGAIAVVAGPEGRAHVLVAEADASRVRHLVVSPGGSASLAPDVPLASVSSAVAHRGGIAVAGPRVADDAPACYLVDRSGEMSSIDLPASPVAVAAWPRLAPKATGADDLWVVWARGRNPATVSIGRLSGAGAVEVVRNMAAMPLFDLQAAQSGRGLDLLWIGVAGPQFHRVDEAGEDVVHEPGPPVLSGRSVLAAGTILTPTTGRELEIWHIDAGADQVLQLPEAPEGRAAQISAVDLVAANATSGPAYLMWRTQTLEEGDVGGLAAPTRSWIAELTETWTVLAVAELPAGTGRVVPLGDELLAISAEGLLTGWVSALPQRASGGS